MHPSRHAEELLKAIATGQTAELEQRLGHAATDCRAAAHRAPYEQESFELLEACVQALKSYAVSSPRGKAAVQILVHLADTVEAERLMLSPLRGNCRSATSAFSHH